MKKILKKWTALLCAAVCGVGCMATLTACNKDKLDREVTVYMPDGAPALAMAGLMAQDTEDNGISYFVTKADGIASKVTYKDETQNADFCVMLLKRLKENGVHTAVDTCGYVGKDALDKVIPYTDIFLYDIKAFDGTVHEKCTGQDNNVILENLRYLDEKGCKIEIRIPYVPNWNAGEVENIATILSKMQNITKIRVLPYHNFAGPKFDALGIKNTLPAVLPNEEEMQSVRESIKQIIGEKLIID